MEYTFDENQLNKIENVFQEELLPLGLHVVILIDMAGNVIVESNNGKMKHDRWYAYVYPKNLTMQGYCKLATSQDILS